MEVGPAVINPEEMAPEPDLLEVMGDQVATVLGFTGTFKQLAGLCPYDLSQASLQAKNKFVIKAANEAGHEIPAEYEPLFTRVLEQNKLERKFTVAGQPEKPAPAVDAAEQSNIKITQAVEDEAAMSETVTFRRHEKVSEAVKISEAELIELSSARAEAARQQIERLHEATARAFGSSLSTEIKAVFSDTEAATMATPKPKQQITLRADTHEVPPIKPAVKARKPVIIAKMPALSKAEESSSATTKGSAGTERRSGVSRIVNYQIEAAQRVNLPAILERPRSVEKQPARDAFEAAPQAEDLYDEPPQPADTPDTGEVDAVLTQDAAQNQIDSESLPELVIEDDIIALQNELLGEPAFIDADEANRFDYALSDSMLTMGIPELAAPIEEVDQAITQLTAALETSDTGKSDSISQIIEKIISLPYKLEAMAADNPEYIEEQLTELLIELFEAAGIEPTPDLLDSFVKLTRADYFEELFESSKNRENTVQKLPGEIGTREFLQKLHHGLSSIKQQLYSFYKIGKSALDLYNLNRSATQLAYSY